MNMFLENSTIDRTNLYYKLKKIFFKYFKLKKIKDLRIQMKNAYIKV